MPYKFTEAGNIVKGSGGHPVWIDDNDSTKEYEIDAGGAQDKINGLVTESNERRKKLGTANEKLETFGDLDPVAARKAIEDVAGMDDKNKLALDNQRDAINETWKGKQTSWETEKTELNGQLFKATTGSQFAVSKVIKGLIYSPVVAAKLYSHHFPVGKSPQFEEGKPIYSLENPGSPANFDEAMSQIIDADPNKNDILKATAGDGGDGHQTNEGGDGGQDLSARDNIKAGLAARGIK